MGLTLSESQIRDLRELSARLLAVVDAEDLGEWAKSVFDLVGPVFGADRAFLLTPDGDTVAFSQSDADMTKASEAYMSYYAPHDFYVTERRRRLGIHAFIHDQLISPEEYRSSTLWNEYLLGYSLCNPAGLSFDHEGVPGIRGLYLYHAHFRSDGFGAENLAKLQLLEPVAGTAMRLAATLRRHREMLTRNIDRLGTGALLVDASGTIVHANRAFRAAAPDRRVERTVLRAARDLVRQLTAGTERKTRAAGPPVPAAEIALIVPPHRFRLRALELTMGLRMHAPHFLVDVRSDRPARKWTALELRQRFGLSGRQAEVALCLADRLSNREIAETLGISPHTARHHSEMVMAKLGVTSRNDVRRQLMSEDPPAEQRLYG